MLDWLQLIYGICTSGEPPSNWREIAFYANVATALAYFWIPIVMAIVFARWREELPYRWLWVGFVLFIGACGLSHVVHGFHLLRDQTPHSWPELLVLAGTAVISLLTAMGFTYLLPKILRLTSPSAARQKMQTAIDVATQDLHRALDHQRLLLNEVHHRVNNNLQVVVSLIDIQQRRGQSSLSENLRDVRGRIRAISNIYGQIQDVGNPTLRSVSFVESIASSLGAPSGETEVSVDVRGDDFEVHLDHATSFALIIHEVLANAFQHAFRNRPTGRILVVLSSSGTRRSVTVLDDGAGLAPTVKNGIGHSLVRSLAGQLEAQVSWKVREEGGTEFTLDYEDPVVSPSVLPQAAPGTSGNSVSDAVDAGYVAGSN